HQRHGQLRPVRFPRQQLWPLGVHLRLRPGQGRPHGGPAPDHRPAGVPMLKHRIAGFSLIEVLVALVILSVGLLGIAAMVSESLKSKDSSYYHTQALNLANAMLDRMRANRDTATNSGYDTGGFGGSTSTTAPSDYCKGIVAHSADEMAACDVAE